MTTDEKLDAIIAALKRIEDRQVRTTGMVEHIEHGEQKQQQGSFGSVEPPKE